MKNSHYVPKFILKKYSDKICLYNIKTGELKENVNPRNAFVKYGFYSDETEEKLNILLEKHFANLLSNKILKCENTIELSHDELKLVKKFLLVSIIRSFGSQNLMQSEKLYYDIVAELSMQQGMSQYEAEQIRPFVEKEIDGETSYDYWMRTINTILDSDGTPQSILEQENKTYPAYRWSTVINAGYLAFWDSDFLKNEFVVTDVGMTSENEVGWNGVTIQNQKKFNFLLNLRNKIKDKKLLRDIDKNLAFVQAFHENFQMFPISAKRMIVLISPFYKFRDMYKDIVSMPSLESLTMLPNENLFSSNQCKYVLPQNDVIAKYHKDDKYIYNIKQLSSQETKYCNALFLDRINTTLGFSSLNKAVGSIVNYKKITDPPHVARVNYKSLYKIINERYQGSLQI